MVSQEKDEVSFISFDGKMDREKMGEMIAKSADKK